MEIIFNSYSLTDDEFFKILEDEEIKSEIKMLQKKFGMKEVIRLANIIEKEKK